MANDLSGKRIAIVVANGFEQIEMTDPREALENAGAETDLISIEDGEVKGWEHTAWGDAFPVDVPIEDADPDDYDGFADRIVELLRHKTLREEMSHRARIAAMRYSWERSAAILRTALGGMV